LCRVDRMRLVRSDRSVSLGSERRADRNGLRLGVDC
jgi:hypothetical protein